MDTKPTAPAGRDRASSVLLLRNEGSRSLQIIGDLATGDTRVMPGCACEIDLSGLDGAVQVTICDGGIQVDCAAEGPDIDEAPFWAEPLPESAGDRTATGSTLR